MLQAIRIGRGVPMLEPWIIDEIRRREEERRRGDRPQLELPVPDGQWPGESDQEWSMSMMSGATVRLSAAWPSSACNLVGM